MRVHCLEKDSFFNLIILTLGQTTLMALTGPKIPDRTRDDSVAEDALDTREEATPTHPRDNKIH